MTIFEHDQVSTGREERQEASGASSQALVDLLSAGEPYAVIFGGQGGTWLENLEELVNMAGIESELSAIVGEAELLLESLNETLTTNLTMDDVTGTWAGLRPLIDTGKGDTAELSREHEITVADGMVTVAGGKLTVSRSMAEQAVDKVCGLLEVKQRCRTTHRAHVSRTCCPTSRTRRAG